MYISKLLSFTFCAYVASSLSTSSTSDYLSSPTGVNAVKLSFKSPQLANHKIQKELAESLPLVVNAAIENNKLDELLNAVQEDRKAQTNLQSELQGQLRPKMFQALQGAIEKLALENQEPKVLVAAILNQGLLDLKNIVDSDRKVFTRNKTTSPSADKGVLVLENLQSEVVVAAITKKKLSQLAKTLKEFPLIKSFKSEVVVDAITNDKLEELIAPELNHLPLEVVNATNTYDKLVQLIMAVRINVVHTVRTVLDVQTEVLVAAIENNQLSILAEVVGTVWNFSYETVVAAMNCGQLRKLAEETRRVPRIKTKYDNYLDYIIEKDKLTEFANLVEVVPPGITIPNNTVIDTINHNRFSELINAVKTDPELLKLDQYAVSRAIANDQLHVLAEYLWEIEMGWQNVSTDVKKQILPAAGTNIETLIEFASVIAEHCPRNSDHPNKEAYLKTKESCWQLVVANPWYTTMMDQLPVRN